VHLVGFIYEDYTRMHGQQNVNITHVLQISAVEYTLYKIKVFQHKLM